MARAAASALLTLTLAACSGDASTRAIGRCAVDAESGQRYGRIAEVTADEQGREVYYIEGAGLSVWNKSAESVAVVDC